MGIESASMGSSDYSIRAKNSYVGFMKVPADESGLKWFCGISFHLLAAS